MEREVVVRGEAEVWVMPDRAEVGITAEADGGTRDAAHQAANDLTSGVDAVLSEMAGSLERVVTTALAVHPRTRWRKGEATRSGWRAARSSQVSITDLGRVGELLARVVEAGGAVYGPAWVVEPAKPRPRRGAPAGSR